MAWRVWRHTSPFRKWWRSKKRRMGFRGSYLGLLALGFFFYGMGLVLGYKPTFLQAYGIPTETFGVCWIVAAVIVNTGVWRDQDRTQFAFAELAMSFWALLLATHWAAPYGWAAAVSWAIPTCLTLLVSSWPDPDPRPRLVENEERRAGGSGP
jgi:hypothetical protein